MKIEKQLLLADEVKNLHDLKVSDGLQYHHEEDGIRAVGPLFIKGAYETKETKDQIFQEVLDMDVLAPEHKLSGEPFFIQIEDYKGTPQQNAILLQVTMSIHGLKEEELRGEVTKKEIARQIETLAQVQVEEPVKPQVEVKKEVEVLKKMETDKEPILVEEAAEPVSTKETTGFDEFEDLFEDADTTYTSYRMIVARGDDTYDTIAKRYEVNEADLRTHNHDKPIEAKTLIILP